MFTKDDIIGILIAVGILVAIGLSIAFIIGFIRVKTEDLLDLIRDKNFNRRFKTIHYILKVSHRNSNEYLSFRKKLKKQIEKTLKKLPDEYIIIKNVCIDEHREKDEVTRYDFCDFAVLSKYGLFLIVADNKMGIIEGNPSNTFVTHYTDGVNKYTIKNPYIDCRLLQNEFKKAFASKYKSIECYSYRVYSDKCRLSLPYTTELLTQESLLYTIKQHQKICLSDDEVKNLACSLMEHTVSSKRYMQNINVYLKSLDDNKIEQIPRQWVY